MSARDAISGVLTIPGGGLLAEAILVALHAMPLPDRLALARAMVPEMAVVPREPTAAMLRACKVAVRSHNRSLRKAGILEAGEYVSHESAPAILYRAMLAAAQEPDHG